MPPTQSQLSRVPVATRKRLAATLGLFATLLVAVGAISATGPSSVVTTVFVTIAFVAAIVVALMGWGVAHSIRDDRERAAALAAERDLDALIDEALAASPRKYGQLCNCGHEHDPNEMHYVDAEPAAEPGPDVCEHDGAGAACTHDCQTCVLAALRPN